MSDQVKGAAIGIDLGTTYSCAAVCFPEKNRVDIITNEQGNKITPSCVAFDDTELFAGEGAKNQIALNPTNTVFGIKRLIGCRFGGPHVQKDITSWPFKIVEGVAGKPTVVVEFKGEEKTFAPEELSAMVLKKMKKDAEDFIGREVTDVVITVPAYFNNKQREATKEAGTIAGFNVMRLLSEPVAAALAYGLDVTPHKKWRKKNVLVFDLGGGTFDVSLLTTCKKGVMVKAVGGDTHLGGEDFDTTLVNYCIKEFQNRHGEVDIRGHPRAMGRLKVACEKAKRDLSSTPFARIAIDCLYNGIDFSFKISRAKFDELNSSFFEKCIQIMEKCLVDGKMKKKDVDEVVLVGGSTRIPKVQRMVEDFFDGKTLCKNMNGDEVVAIGAAYLASELNGNDANVEHDVVLQDVTPLSLGIEVGKQGERSYMDVIIPKNTSIPTSKRKTFNSRVNQTSVRIPVYQGESKEVNDNILLGMFHICGLTLGPNGISEIEVCFSIDINGILLVSAVEKSTGQRKSITIAKM